MLYDAHQLAAANLLSLWEEKVWERATGCTHRTALHTVLKTFPNIIDFLQKCVYYMYFKFHFKFTAHVGSWVGD